MLPSAQFDLLKYIIPAKILPNSSEVKILYKILAEFDQRERASTQLQRKGFLSIEITKYL